MILLLFLSSSILGADKQVPPWKDHQDIVPHHILKRLMRPPKVKNQDDEDVQAMDDLMKMAMVAVDQERLKNAATPPQTARSPQDDQMPPPKEKPKR